MKTILGGCAAAVSASPIAMLIERAGSRGAAPLGGIDLAIGSDVIAWKVITFRDAGDMFECESGIFTREEVARIYNLPPRLLGDPKFSTYANAEIWERELRESLVPSAAGGNLCRITATADQLRSSTS